jgi:uncharacterized membrane protein
MSFPPSLAVSGHPAPVAGFLLAAALLSACGEEASVPAVASPSDDLTAPDSLATASPDGAIEPARPPLPVTPADEAPIVPPAEWIVPQPLAAAGEEPFWRLDLQDGWFVFTRAGLPQIEAEAGPARRIGSDDVFEAPPLSVRIRRAPCQSLAGVAFDASAVVAFDGVTFEGCAFSATPAAVSPEAGLVVDALSSIDACLKALDQPALVTGVYPRESDRTGVALRTRNGSLYECGADRDGRTVVFLDPIEPTAAGEWMTSAMRFLRLGISTGPVCQEAEAVMAGNAVVGHFIPRSCRY